jgi:hypothetical protein
MTRWYATILLSVFLIQVLLPVFPWIEYYMNHTYIVENLCVQRNQEVNTCNGCCHLEKEIKKVAPQPEKSDSTTPSNKINTKLHFDEYILANKGQKSYQLFVSYRFFRIDDLYAYLYYPTCFHPPEMIILHTT